MIESSSGVLPYFLPTWIMPGIWWVLPSRTRLATAVLKIRISSAATRPFLSTRLNRPWATTPFERLGQGGANFVLLFAGKNVNDAVHRLGRALRMQRAEDQMPRAGGGQGQFDRFQIAQFADQNDVRVLAQRPAQGRGKRLGVQAHFAMIDQAAFAFVNEFDRVLDSNDMVLAVLVGVIHNGRQRGGFARPGRPGHHHQALVQHGEFLEHRRQRRVELLKILERKDLAGNLAKNRRDAVFSG